MGMYKGLSNSFLTERRKLGEFRSGKEEIRVFREESVTRRVRAMGRSHPLRLRSSSMGPKLSFDKPVGSVSATVLCAAWHSSRPNRCKVVH